MKKMDRGTKLLIWLLLIFISICLWPHLWFFAMSLALIDVKKIPN